MKGKTNLFLAAGLIAFSIYGCGGSSSANSTADSSAESSEMSESLEMPVETEDYSTELTTGFYTGGVDIPVGDYDLTLVSGSGNVYCDSDKPINEVFGTDKADDEIKSFNGVGVDEGAVLQLSGSVKLKAVSKNAQVSSMKSRTENKDKAITLSSGNYTAGTDFPEGTYTIVAVDGTGNVMSDDENNSDNNINVILSTHPEADQDDSKEFKNAPFPKGTTLQLDNITVEMIPLSD